MDIHLDVIQSRFELGSKSHIFMENDKIISLLNLFNIYCLQKFCPNEKLNLYIERNFQINARNKLAAKCLLTFSHDKRSHLEYSG